MRQSLAAPICRRREPVPARCGPCGVSVFPARRRGDPAVLERGAELVANTVEGCNHIACVAAGFYQDGIDRRLIEVTVDSFGQRAFQASGMLEREGDIGEGSMVAHGQLI